MNDQAQGLRDMVAESGPALSSLPPETAEVYRAKLAQAGVRAGIVGSFERNMAQLEALILDQGSPVEMFVSPKPSRLDVVDDLITYRRLWLDLKAELARRAEGHCVTHSSDEPVDGVKISQVTWEMNWVEREAREILSRMEQAETLAFYVHVPSATASKERPDA